MRANYEQLLQPYSIDPGSLLPVIFNAGGQQLSFFSTITTFGTPQDITAQELRIEHFFPMDDDTETWCTAHAPATPQLET